MHKFAALRKRQRSLFAAPSTSRYSSPDGGGTWCSTAVLMLGMETWGFSQDKSHRVATCLEMHEGHVSEKGTR
jgi:hypothetical protein